jgi:hypothetical protein
LRDIYAMRSMNRLEILVYLEEAVGNFSCIFK